MGLINDVKTYVKKSLGVQENGIELSNKGVTLLKDKDGNYSKWIGVYSNSFRDNDLVPEILESMGHIEFVKGVDAGKYDLPELWIWHVPEWKIGKATFVAYDVVQPGVVFAIAGGDIDPDKYGVAKAIAESDVEWRMSHTFVTNSRNDEDDSYRKWVVLEVTILPAGKEANPLTSFGLLSESEDITMIDTQKRDEIKSALGLSDVEIDGLEAQNAKVAANAVDNREFKEASVAEETQEQAAEGEAVVEEVKEEETEATVEDTAEVATEELVEENAVEAEAEAEAEVVEDEDVEEVEDAPAVSNDQDVLVQIADLFKAMDARLDEMSAKVDEAVKSAERAEESAKENAKQVSTPLSGLLSGLNAKYMAQPTMAEVDEEADAELLKAKPEEAETKSAINSKIGSSFLASRIMANQ